MNMVVDPAQVSTTHPIRDIPPRRPTVILIMSFGSDSNKARLDDLVSSLASLDESSRFMGESMLRDFLAAQDALRPFGDRDKVVVFGSARIAPASPLYAATRELARLFALSGYVVITGGGPGAMSAGLEGAGPGNAVGISVELPFESPAEFPDIPVITQQRFFTRKLAMVRRTKGIVVVPGGYGTMDELFEVLTLLQTGKKSPTPVVLLDPEGSGFFAPLVSLVDQIESGGFASPADRNLFTIAESEASALEQVQRFWSNYVSFEGDGRTGFMTLTRPVPAASLTDLDSTFAPFAPFRYDPSSSRLSFRFSSRNYGLLHRLIRVVNEF